MLQGSNLIHEERYNNIKNNNNRFNGDNSKDNENNKDQTWHLNMKSELVNGF